MNTDQLFNIVLPFYFRQSKFNQNGNRYVEFLYENYQHMDGFQSVMYKGQVKFIDKNGQLKYSESLLIKTISWVNEWSKIIDLTFSNELFIYNRVLPCFSALNTSIGKLFAKFYFGQIIFGDTDSKCNGMQILENLQPNGYRMSESKTMLDLPHIFLMAEKLGEFHAYSYQAKKKSPQLFQTLTNNLKETSSLICGEKERITYLYEYYLQQLATYAKYRDKVEVIRDIVKHPYDFTTKVFTTAAEPIAVICHGDFLRNNVLFKYDSRNNPTDIKFIDLANARYCSPISDLGLMLYMHTDQSIRSQYWNQILDAYYNSLKNTFPDNDLVPSRSQILDNFKETILQPYLIVMFFLPFMMAVEENPTEPNWLASYFEPEHEQYKHLSLAAPVHVTEKAMVNLAESSNKKYIILDVLFDIIDREFV